MGQDRDEERTTEARIDRLRERLQSAKRTNSIDGVAGVVAGVLDLLADEMLGEARK